MSSGPAKTRFHEIGHVLLNQTVESDFTDSGATPRNIREGETRISGIAVFRVAGSGRVGVCERIFAALVAWRRNPREKDLCCSGSGAEGSENEFE